MYIFLSAVSAGKLYIILHVKPCNSKNSSNLDPMDLKTISEFFKFGVKLGHLAPLSENVEFSTSWRQIGYLSDPP